MNVKSQIKSFLESVPEPKRSELEQLHKLAVGAVPGSRLWFDEGKNAEGKQVTNPTIGYGFQVMKYANGTTRDFFRIGLAANKTGFSVYVLGLADKTYLAKTFGKKLGRASVTGYCIKFKTVKDIDLDVLESAIRYGLEYESA